MNVASRVTVRPEPVEGRVLALDAQREPVTLPRSQQQAIVERAHEIRRRLGVRPVAGITHRMQAGGGKVMTNKWQGFGIYPWRVFTPDDPKWPRIARRWRHRQRSDEIRHAAYECRQIKPPAAAILGR